MSLLRFVTRARVLAVVQVGLVELSRLVVYAFAAVVAAALVGCLAVNVAGLLDASAVATPERVLLAFALAVAAAFTVLVVNVAVLGAGGLNRQAIDNLRLLGLGVVLLFLGGPAHPTYGWALSVAGDVLLLASLLPSRFSGLLAAPAVAAPVAVVDLAPVVAGTPGSATRS